MYFFLRLFLNCLRKRPSPALPWMTSDKWEKSLESICRLNNVSFLVPPLHSGLYHSTIETLIARTKTAKMHGWPFHAHLKCNWSKINVLDILEWVIFFVTLFIRKYLESNHTWKNEVYVKKPPVSSKWANWRKKCQIKHYNMYKVR